MDRCFHYIYEYLLSNTHWKCFCSLEIHEYVRIAAKRCGVHIGWKHYDEQLRLKMSRDQTLLRALKLILH